MQEPLGPFQDTSNTVSLREYGDILRRRRAIILQTFVIVLVAGVLVTLFTPPTYQATARMLIQPPAFFINSVNTSDPLSDLFQISQPYSIMTQVEMLQTGETRQKVSKQLNTNRLPGMSIRPVEGTQIIEIIAEGDNPELVATAPNTLMEYYIEDQRQKRTADVSKALEYATKQTRAFNGQVEALEQRIRQFKSKNNVIELGRNREEQIGLVNGLSSGYQQARNQLALLLARMKNTEDKMREMEKNEENIRVLTVSPVADPRIQELDERIFQIQSQLRVLETELVNSIKVSTADINKANAIDTIDAKANPKAKKESEAALNRIRSKANSINPNSPQLLDEDPRFVVLLRDLSRQLERKHQLVSNYRTRAEQINPVYQSFKDRLVQESLDASTLAQQAELLGRQLQEARGRLVQFPLWEQEWNKLQRAYASASQQATYFGNQLGVLQLREKTIIERSPAQIMQKAESPTEPIRPKKAQNIIFAGLLGLFFGLCLALLQELFDDRINSPEEAERVLRLPSLGHIPLIEEEGLRLIKDISTFSPLMEAYRSLRTNINFAAVGNQVKSVVITSSVPAEGKSTTVANLAMAMALDSKTVIIVDADLRRPSMHKLFKIDSSPGLTDVLVGTHSVEDVIRPTGVQNVQVIPAGSPPPNPAELLGSAAMGQLLATLESQADVVLFDSPPALAVADSIVLSARSNGVLLVVGYGETKKTSTKKALDLLARANANVLGTVLNRMDGPAGGYYYGKYYVPASERNSSDNRGSGGSTPALDQPASALTQTEDTTVDNPGEKGRNS